MGIAAISPTVRLIGKDQVEKSPNANHPAGGSHRQLYLLNIRNNHIGGVR
jgi:hypothetical protein